MTTLRRVRVFEVVRPHRRRHGHWRAVAFAVGVGAFAVLLSLSLLAVVMS